MCFFSFFFSLYTSQYSSLAFLTAIILFCLSACLSVRPSSCCFVMAGVVKRRLEWCLFLYLPFVSLPLSSPLAYLSVIVSAMFVPFFFFFSFGVAEIPLFRIIHSLNPPFNFYFGPLFNIFFFSSLCYSFSILFRYCSYLPFHSFFSPSSSPFSFPLTDLSPLQKY